MSSLGIFDKGTKTYKKVADLSKTAVIDSSMSDTSTNPVQNKVVKSYVDGRTALDTSMSDASTKAVQNKVVKKYVDDHTVVVDSAMSDTSTNPVQNKVVKRYVDYHTAVDSAMSDTSTNPVQNKVVKSYVDGRTTLDTSMSDASTKAVQNKVVKSYVDTRTALDTSMSDASTKAVQNKVVKSYVDGKFKQKLVAHMSGDGKTSYCQLCTIKINQTYVDTPIEITVQERFRSTLDKLTVLFASTDNNDPNLDSFKVFGECSDWYISKRAASTWVIYGTKGGSWAGIKVVDYIGIEGVNVTWDVTGVTALPDSRTKAVWGGNVSHAVNADSASSASTVNGHTVNSDVPSGAKFTDTTYNDATTSAHGLMTPAMVSKLNGIAEGANRTTIDSSMSDTSTNPVQNKVVTSNLVDLKKETTVNLLNPTLETTTQDGITCTNNGDGTYTLNGTVSAASNRAVIVVQYCADMIEKHLNENLLLLGCPKHDKSISMNLHLNGVMSHAVDNGNGHIFKFSQVAGRVPIQIEIATNGTTVNNLVFKPMLTTNLSATYDDFVPYTGDTGKLNSDVSGLAKKAKFEINDSVFSYPGMPDIAITGDTAGRFSAISDEWLDTEGRVIKFKNYKDEKTHISIYAATPAHSALFLQAYSPSGASVEVKSPLLFYNESDTVERETISCDVTAPISTTTGIATSIAFKPIVIKNV